MVGRREHGPGPELDINMMLQRYLASNSKDQSIKLWDLRRFSDTDDILEGLQVVRERAMRGWDYRWTLLLQRIRSIKKANVNIQMAGGSAPQAPGGVG